MSWECPLPRTTKDFLRCFWVVWPEVGQLDGQLRRGLLFHQQAWDGENENQRVGLSSQVTTKSWPYLGKTVAIS